MRNPWGARTASVEPAPNPFGLVEPPRPRCQIEPEEAQRLREKQCALRGHNWEIITALARGPVRVLCDHCGTDSGLRQPPKEAA